MNVEDKINQIIDEIDIPSDKFSMAYDIVEYCINSVVDDFNSRNCSNCINNSFCGVYQFLKSVKNEDEEIDKFNCNQWKSM